MGDHGLHRLKAASGRPGSEKEEQCARSREGAVSLHKLQDGFQFQSALNQVERTEKEFAYVG